MQKAQPFENYFKDQELGEKKLARMELARRLVHEIYPDVQERVAYAMPGFYPKEAKKATQQLFLLMANKNWLGIYGTHDLPESALDAFSENNLAFGKGSIKVPYDMPEEAFKKLLELVMTYNAARHGFEL